jgi:hypothetical protein
LPSQCLTDSYCCWRFRGNIISSMSRMCGVASREVLLPWFYSASSNGCFIESAIASSHRKISKSDSIPETTRFLQYNPRHYSPQYNIQEPCLTVSVAEQSLRSKAWSMSRFPCVDNAVEVELNIHTGMQVFRDEMVQLQTSSRRSSCYHATCYYQSHSLK